MWTRGEPRAAADRKPKPDETPAKTRSEPQPRQEPETMATLRLGTSIVIKGLLTASEHLTIHGQFEGTIEVPGHTLTVGREAQVDAFIIAKAVVVEGTVQGNVTATDKIEIRATAKLHGDVVAPRIAITDGASVCGTVDTQAVDVEKLKMAASTSATAVLDDAQRRPA